MKIKPGLQHAARRRAERLQELSEQVASGKLVIRQATAEEREKYGIKVDGQKRGGSCR